MFIAAGPYTIESDLEYEPLGALIDIIALEKPDLVILVRHSSPLLVLKELIVHFDRLDHSLMLIIQ